MGPRSKSCRLVVPLREAAVGVSVHPDGLHIAVAYDNQLALSHIGIDGLLPWRDLPLANVRAVVYAHGGHLLAVAFGSAVAVFDAYHLTRVAHLTGHIAPCVARVGGRRRAHVGQRGRHVLLVVGSTFERIRACRLYKGAAVAALGILSAPRASSAKMAASAAAPTPVARAATAAACTTTGRASWVAPR